SRTVEVGPGRPGWHIHNPTHGIDTEAGPATSAARRRPPPGRPDVVAELAGMRNRVEGPADRAGADVVRAHVARGRPFLLSHSHALDEQILVNRTGARRDEIRIADRARQTGGEIQGAGLAKRRNTP